MRLRHRGRDRQAVYSAEAMPAGRRLVLLTAQTLSSDVTFLLGFALAVAGMVAIAAIAAAALHIAELGSRVVARQAAKLTMVGATPTRRRAPSASE